MKSVVILGLMLFAGGSAFAAPCATGSLEDFIGLGAAGCEFGVVTFSGFELVPGQNGATIISSTEVQITPGGSGFNPTLSFGFTNPTANASELLESIFRFSVSGSPLAGATLGLAGAVTGDGLVTSVLNVCAGGFFSGLAPDICSGTAGVAITSLDANNQQLTDSTGPFFTSFFDVFVDLTLDGGPSGTATLTSSTLTIAAVPEPSAAYLLAAGMAVLAGIKARRKQ